MSEKDRDREREYLSEKDRDRENIRVIRIETERVLE